MHEVFSKIIEQLEERTSFLSDCTKYGNKDAEQQNKSYSTMMMYEVSDLVDDLIEIVKQEAEEYDNGWISCSERMPERQPLPAPYQPSGDHKKKTNFDMCCESMEAMAQIIDIAKIGWTKEQIMEWLQKEECEVPEQYQQKGEMKSMSSITIKLTEQMEKDKNNCSEDLCMSESCTLWMERENCCLLELMKGEEEI